MTRRLALLLLLTGCDLDLDLTADATSIIATATGDGTTQVQVCAGPQDLFTCNGEESFWISMAGEEVMASQGLFSFGWQGANFDTDAPGTDIVVTRGSDSASATVSLPEPFEIEAGPAPDEVVSRRRDDIAVRWAPSGTRDAMSWAGLATCEDGNSNSQQEIDSDDGQTVVDGSDLPEVSSRCQSKLSLRRQRDGVVSGRFPDGSSIVAHQERSIDFILEP